MTILIVKGAPHSEWDDELASEAIDRAKELALETGETYTVVQDSGTAIVAAPVLRVITPTEYIDTYGED